jgi:hypothetical protein
VFFNISNSALDLSVIILAANSSFNFTTSFSTAQRRCSSCALCIWHVQHNFFPNRSLFDMKHIIDV